MQVDIPGPDLAMIIQCVIVSIGGVVANGSLLSVIIRSKDLRRKDYIWFIFNRTLVDFIFCIQLGTLHVMGILASPTSPLCIAAAAFLDMLSPASIYAEPLLACNRYVSIFHSNSYKKIYKLRNIFLMCLGAWMLGGISSLTHILVGSLGRVTGSFCSVKFVPESLAVTLGVNFSLILLSLCSVLFFNFKMFKFLKRHQTQPMTNSQRSKLQSDREMLKFIFASAFLPVMFSFPGMVIVIIQMINAVSPWLNFSAQALYMVSLVVNPVVTLLMVRPIKSQFIITLKKLTGQNNAVAGIQLDQVAMGSQLVSSPVVVRVDEIQTIP